MSRAVNIFIQNGMYPIAAPTNYNLKRHINLPAGAFLPSIDNLRISRIVIYEWIGAQWLRIQKKIEKFL